MRNIDNITKENEQLHLALNELQVLNDIATTITSIQPIEKIVDQIIFKCIKHLGVEEGTISLLNKGSQENQFNTLIRRMDSTVEKVPYKLDNQLTGWMLKNQKILVSNDIQRDDRFHSLDKGSLHSILCAPLKTKGDFIGYLAVFNKINHQDFSREDQRLLSIIASQSAQVIENARLYEEEKALFSIQEEMRMAREIQLNLLPGNTPSIPGFQIAATNIPAKSVGGDYYDFLSLSSNKTGLCIGDITGKGMPAAMLMANLQAILRSQAMNFEDCRKCLEKTNNQLFKNTDPTKFATLFYGILDPTANILEYANGGHDAPLLFREKGTKPEPLDATGLLLGMMENVDYQTSSITFHPGDTLLLYTDGITEAKNPEGQQFGLDRLCSLVKNNRTESPQSIAELILSEVKSHATDTAQSDDITLMLIQRENC